MLHRCNPSLPIHDWNVVKVEEMKRPTNQIVLILNKDSLGPIEAAGNELSFGFSSVSIRVHRSDTAAGIDPSDKPVVEQQS